jgi:hypothetical protein
MLRDVVQLRRRRSVQVLERQRGQAAEQEHLQRVRSAHDAVVDVEALGAQAVAMLARGRLLAPQRSG